MTFIRYAAIQLLAYGIDMGLFLIVLKSGLSEPIAANVLSKIAAGLFAFVVHRRFTFRVEESADIRHQAIRYFLLLALNIPVASAILALLFVWITEPVAAKFIADIVCVALTYGLSKHFIFIGKSATAGQSKSSKQEVDALAMKEGKSMTNYHVSKISRPENALIYLVSISLFGLLFYYYKTVMPYTYGDTAFLIEVISNLANGAEATSSLLAQNAAQVKLGFGELAIYCQQGLAAAQFATDPYDVFSMHAYVILYLIAQAARVIGALNAMSAFTALAFSSIPFIAYVYLRKSGVSVAVSILASAISMIHPAWQISSGGQFYVDRLFIPLGLLYAIFLHQYFKFDQKAVIELRTALLWMLLFGVLGGLTSERNMLVIGIFSIGYALVVRTPNKRKFLIIGFSILCVIYPFIYTRFFNGTPDNARVQSYLFQLSKLIEALKQPGLSEYLWFNLMLLALPAVFAPRVCIAVLPIIALNCFITMGGAEKNGWATHYHSHYYGFLIAVFLIAIVSANDDFHGRFAAIIHRFLKPILAGIMLALLISITHYKGQGIFLALWDYYGRTKELSASRTQKDMFDKLAKNVPAGATVTASHWGMAAWYLRGNKVNIFPLGVGLNDYMMIQTEGTTPNIKVFSAVRFRTDTTLANECFAPIISKNYKELSREGTWVLFKKKTQEGTL